MALLEGDQVIGDECQVKSFDGTPDCARPVLGATIRPWLDPSNTNPDGI